MHPARPAVMARKIIGKPKYEETATSIAIKIKNVNPKAEDKLLWKNSLLAHARILFDKDIIQKEF